MTALTQLLVLRAHRQPTKFNFDASNHLFLDASANAHTDTNGVLDMDVRSGDANVNGIDITLRGYANDTNIANKSTVYSGGLITGGYAMGNSVYLYGHADDSGGGLIGNAVSSSGSSATAGNGFWWANYVDFNTVPVASSGGASMYKGSLDYRSTGEISGLELDLNNDTAAASNIFGSKISLSSSQNNANVVGYYADLDLSGTPTASYGLYINSSGAISMDKAISINGLVTTAITAASGDVIFNESGDSGSDFRVEGDTISNLLFVDASSDNIGIGTSTPGASKLVEINVSNTDTSHNYGLHVYQNYDGTQGSLLSSYGIYSELTDNATAGSAAIYAATIGTENEEVYAINATTLSSKGMAVKASATYGSGLTFGVQSHVYSPDGYAGFFRCIDDSSNNYDCDGVGVHAQADGNNGRGLTARSGDTDSDRNLAGDGIGIEAESYWQDGIGVYTTVYGSAATALYAYATNTTGINYAVYGKTDSSNGWSGYFTGGKFGVNNLAGDAGAYPSVTWDSGTGRFYYASSSRKTKEDIQPLKDDFYKILKAEPKSFISKSSGTRQIGYIAEEFDKLGLNNLVFYDKNNEPFSLKYDKITLYLLEILKDHQAIIDKLKIGAGADFSGKGVNLDNLKEITADKWSIDENGVLKVKVATESGDKKDIYALSSTKVEITLSGSSRLENGVKEIRFDDIDPQFADIISSAIDLKIVVTPTSQCNGLYIQQKLKDLLPDGNSTKHAGFVVKELNNGNSDATFDWLAIGRRKGYVDLEEAGCDKTHLENCATLELCRQLPNYYWDGQCHIVSDTAGAGNATENTGADYSGAGNATDNTGI